MKQGNWEFETQNDLGYGQLIVSLWHRCYWFAELFSSVLAIAVLRSLVNQPDFKVT